LTIVVDTNVIIAALIKDGIVRKLIINNPGDFITPDWCFDEVVEHKDAWNKKNLRENEIDKILDDLKEKYVIPIANKYYKKRMKEAKNMIGDPDDEPIIALALAVENKGIWSFNTKHFKKEKMDGKIELLNTNDVKILLKYSEDEAD